MMKRESFFFFFALVLEGLVGLHRPFNFNFFSVSGWGIDLDYCDIEWFALETNQDHSVVSLSMRAIAFLLRDSCTQ